MKEREIAAICKANLEELVKKNDELEVHQIEIREQTEAISNYEADITTLNADLAKS